MKDIRHSAFRSRSQARQHRTNDKVDRYKINEAVARTGKILDLSFAITEQNGRARLKALDPARLRMPEAALDNGGSQDDDVHTITGLDHQLLSHRLRECVG